MTDESATSKNEIVANIDFLIDSLEEDENATTKDEIIKNIDFLVDSMDEKATPKEKTFTKLIAHLNNLITSLRLDSQRLYCYEDDWETITPYLESLEAKLINMSLLQKDYETRVKRINISLARVYL